MTNPLRALLEHYRAYHEYGPPRLKYMGYLGAFSVAAFYFVRFTRPDPRLFDDIALRAIAFVLFTLLALKDQWPRRLKPHYIGFSYAVLLYCLPCFTLIVALQRGGGVPAISNAFITLCFLVLLTDWRNTLVMLVAGTAMAVGFYVGTTPDPKVPMDLVAQLPAFAVVLIGGNLFKFSTEQIDAERKLRATQALAGSIAHEMRNPLSRIKHSLERMQHALPPPTTTGEAQVLGAAQANALYRHLAETGVAVDRGLQVIAMTLDEVSAKPIDTSAFSLLSAGDATRKALQEYAFESDAEAERVQVHVTGDFAFRGDETAYLFVIFNLVKNAAFYFASSPQSRVTITVGDNEVRVHDTGPGIAPHVLERLFQPFASAGKSGGTGLGLSYCRRVMQAFGGDIACESVLGQYTKFTLRFPPVEAQAAQAWRDGIVERARASFTGRRILVVDDDAAQRLTTRHKLQVLAAEIDLVADGPRALEALSRRPYDLVLLDLNMPGMDGYAVADRIRGGQVPVNAEVPIVAYTSEPAHLAVVKTRKSGMDGFVGKPAGQVQLLQAMVEALARAGSARLSAALANRRFVLADDNAHNRKGVVAYLRHAGATVAEAGDGQAVLDFLRAEEPWDAVLLDINMPGMDGFATARAVRALAGQAAHIPIVALTAHSDSDTVAAAQAAGMSGFITKPVDAAVLYGKLAELVGGTPEPALHPTVSAIASGASDQLLNVDRLESYRRIGMLDELLNDYVPEIAALVARLRGHFERQDMAACLDTLHSLLGMSGEAGAQALYHAVRRVYVPMVECRCWPPQGGWLPHVEMLAADTVAALKRYAAPAPAQG